MAGSDNGIVVRILLDPFSRSILTAAVWACVYGLLLLWGNRSDHGPVPGKIKAWILARDQQQEVPAVRLCEIWQIMVRRRSAPLSYAVWILPTMGFLGTVLGISAAIGDMSGVFSQDADRASALSSVLANLEFAFDTTFAGLFGAIPVMALLLAYRVSADAAERVVYESPPQEALS